MPDDLDENGAEVSDAMSDNEYDDDEDMLKDEHDKMGDANASSDGADNGEPKKKYDPKDPMRPRRKKARRACYACQRAHLTCGKHDEVFFAVSSVINFCCLSVEIHPSSREPGPTLL